MFASPARATALSAALALFLLAPAASAQPNKASKHARAGEAGVTRIPRATTPASEDVKSLVSRYARLHGVPETLAHRIVVHESRYNPGLKGRAHYGLMQISLPTARQMGYSGPPQGLLDAQTNLAYGMPYLANAWVVSGRSEARAMSLYSRGYYYEAKRKGLVASLRTARSAPVAGSDAEEIAAAQ